MRSTSSPRTSAAVSYTHLIFGKENVQEKCLFRVTRNADIDVKEGMMDHDIDYREIMADLLKRRRKLAAVRLQVIPAAPQVTQLLCSRLELTHKRVFVQKSPLDLSFFFKLTSRMESDGHPELFYSSARPMLPPQDYDLTAEVEKHDVLLSYPYQSIRPFIAMLKKAAQDPDVISIKMTLYRIDVYKRQEKLCPRPASAAFWRWQQRRQRASSGWRCGTPCRPPRRRMFRRPRQRRCGSPSGWTSTPPGWTR